MKRILETRKNDALRIGLVVSFDTEQERVLTEVFQDPEKQFSPKELRKLGNWLIQNGLSLGARYTNTDLRQSAF